MMEMEDMIGLLDMMDVSRVEILRGPQGTLFGRNTTAGLIQIINNKPTQESETSVRIGAGTHNHQRYGFTVNRALSDTLAARAEFMATRENVRRHTNRHLTAVNDLDALHRAHLDTSSLAAIVQTPPAPSMANTVSHLQL